MYEAYLNGFESSLFWILKLHISTSLDLLWRFPHQPWQEKISSPVHS